MSMDKNHYLLIQRGNTVELKKYNTAGTLPSVMRTIKNGDTTVKYNKESGEVISIQNHRPTGKTTDEVQESLLKMSKKDMYLNEKDLAKQGKMAFDVLMSNYQSKNKTLILTLLYDDNNKRHLADADKLKREMDSFTNKVNYIAKQNNMLKPDYFYVRELNHELVFHIHIVFFFSTPIDNQIITSIIDKWKFGNVHQEIIVSDEISDFRYYAAYITMAAFRTPNPKNLSARDIANYDNIDDKRAIKHERMLLMGTIRSFYHSTNMKKPTKIPLNSAEYETLLKSGTPTDTRNIKRVYDDHTFISQNDIFDSITPEIAAYIKNKRPDQKNENDYSIY